MHKILGGIVVAALALGLGACDGDKDPATKADPTQRDETPVKPAWTLDLDVISQPEIADGIALVLAKGAHGSVDIVGVDAKSGKKLWTRGWSPGAVPPGYAMDADVFTTGSGEKVTAFNIPPKNPEAKGRFDQQIAVVDLHTGKDLHRTPKRQTMTPLDDCLDGIDVCFDDRTLDRAQRIDLETGEVADDPNGSPDNARNIGDGGLFASSDRPGEKLGVKREKLLWSRPMAEVMGDGVSSDNGWNWDWDRKADRYVGDMTSLDPTTKEKLRGGGSVTIDLSTSYRLAALDGSDGTLLWDLAGARHACLGLEQNTSAVRCRVQGVQHITDSTVTETSDPAVTLEGYDAKGKTTWSIDADPEAAEDLLYDRELKVTDGRTVLFPSVDGLVVVDLETGDTSPADPEGVFVCRSASASVTYEVPWYVNGENHNERYGDPFYSPCHADGSAATDMTVSAVRDAAAKADNSHYVMNTEDGLVGYVLD